VVDLPSLDSRGCVQALRINHVCGIAGQIRTDGRSVDPELLASMCARLEHRGPDSRGTHISDQAGLGIQRLRVIDLTTGDQPLYNEDRSIVVVLNGEIYNFKELRERLRLRGHKFATDGDTEVIVHLYEEDGPDCVHSLRGMFAFALWDRRRRRLLLARDRVGKKPLYYAYANQGVTFASELPALLQDGEISRDIDYQALDCYLAYQYIPAPLSAFRAVRKLPPACTLVFEDGRTSVRRYWDLDYRNKRRFSDAEELHAEIRDAIRRATRQRMIADVPIGAFLSGGVDSSAVVAAMAEESSEPVKTFSIGFDYEPFNELPFARRIAEQFGTDHQEFVITPDAVGLIPRLVRHYGEPFADSSAIPSFYVSELTRQHVTVALNGDGGDESFAGYNRYVSNVLASRLAGLPHGMRRLASAVGNQLPSDRDMSSTRNRTKRLLRSLSLSPSERYARHISFFDQSERDDAYTPEFKRLTGPSITQAVIDGPWNDASGEDLLDIMLEVDVKTSLPGDLLVKMDIATMAHSLEARSPFLDPDVMQLAASLPPSLKARGAQKKVVLRQALRGWVPDDILDRPKWGFAIPLGEWFRNDLREYVADVLFDPRTMGRGYFRPEVIQGYFESHVNGRADNSPRIWALVMLELWHREFVDSPQPVRSA
jgi:asparagine synthase (glutamine-hydrolysing)